MSWNAMMKVAQANNNRMGRDMNPIRKVETLRKNESNAHKTSNGIGRIACSLSESGCSPPISFPNVFHLWRTRMK